MYTVDPDGHRSPGTSRIHARVPDADLPHLRLGSGATPVRRLVDWGGDVWVKDDGAFGDGGWGGNKVRKLEWIIPEAHRRERDTLFTVGGIGTHWGLAAALYGREHGLHTALGLIEQPVDDHVRDQLSRLEASGAALHRFESVRALKVAAPGLLWKHRTGWRLPYYLPAGGSSPIGTLGYVEAGLEIAEQVASGELPEPGVVVVPVGSGGTVAGLVVGLRLAGLDTSVMGVVVNDALRLDAGTLARLANRTIALMRERGGNFTMSVRSREVLVTHDYLGATYGASTPEGLDALAAAADQGLGLEPVYTAKAFAAVRDLASVSDAPVLVLNTHGPRPARATSQPA